jgi:hypothetical protein
METCRNVGSELGFTNIPQLSFEVSFSDILSNASSVPIKGRLIPLCFYQTSAINLSITERIIQIKPNPWL